MARKSTSRIVEKHFEDVSQYKAANDKEIKESQHSNRLKIKIEDLKTLKPLTKNQKLFFDAYANGEIFMMLSGSAGSGKSFISLSKAIEEVMGKSNPYNQILIIRSAVQTRDIGFIKGDLSQKTEMFESPYEQIFADLFNRKDAYQRLTEQGYVDFITTTCLRGMTYNNTIIFFDEIQSATYHELVSVLTRCGKNTKLIMAGDTKQNDLIKKSSEVSGLPQFIKVAETMQEFCRVHFLPEDIVRSGLVRSWLLAEERLGF